MKKEALKSISPSYNYSLREFLHYISKYKPEVEVLQAVDNVMSAFLLINQNFGYVPELLWLAMLFLCFSSEPVAVQLLVHFMEKIIPPDMTPIYVREAGLNLTDLSSRTVEIMEAGFKLKQADMQLVIKYMETQYSVLVYSIGINLFCFQTFFLIFDLLLKKKNFQNFEVALTVSLCLNIDSLQAFKGNVKGVEIDILRKQSAQQLLRKMQEL